MVYIQELAVSAKAWVVGRKGQVSQHDVWPGEQLHTASTGRTHRRPVSAMPDSIPGSSSALCEACMDTRHSHHHISFWITLSLGNFHKSLIWIHSNVVQYLISCECLNELPLLGCVSVYCTPLSDGHRWGNLRGLVWEAPRAGEGYQGTDHRGGWQTVGLMGNSLTLYLIRGGRSHTWPQPLTRLSRLLPPPTGAPLHPTLWPSV